MRPAPGRGAGPERSRRWHQLRLAIVSWIERTDRRWRRQRALSKLTPVAIETIYPAAHAA